MGEAIEVDGGESPFTAQIVFSAIENPLEKGMATHPSILVWTIP